MQMHKHDSIEILIFVLMLHPEALYSKYLHFFQEKTFMKKVKK